MSVHVSMSQSSFGDDDYDDGEVKKLVVGSTIWNALHEDIWLNCSPSTRQDRKNVLWYLFMSSCSKYVAGGMSSITHDQL